MPGGQYGTQNADFVSSIERNHEHLVDEVRRMVDLFKRFFEQIELHVEINAFGSGRSHQSP